MADDLSPAADCTKSIWSAGWRGPWLPRERTSNVPVPTDLLNAPSDPS